MRRRLVRHLFPLVIVALLAVSAPAAARHNADQHSTNMVHDFNAPGTRFINSDLAFWGNRLYSGNYGGFRIFDISSPEAPLMLADVACEGFQGDVSVWRNRLLFVSVDEPQIQPAGQPRGACSAPAPRARTQDPSNFEGVRIFDVSDPRQPRFLAGVQTDCGSHTHTLVPDLKRDRLLIYVSSYSLRPGPGCGPDNPEGEDPLHRKISIVAVPLDAPAGARVISEPPVQAPVWDSETLFGDPSFDPTVACHDIQVFLELDIAAASCVSDWQLWDISNRARPKTMEAVHIDHPAVDFWHSGVFTWDGKYVVLGDEAFQEPSQCEPRNTFSRIWIYRVSRPRRPVSSFVIPRPQAGQYCTAHLANVVPINGRYLLASGWYEGASSLIDFTRPRRPREIAFYDAQTGIPANTWSTYWYRDYIFASDRQRPTTRGLDVFHVATRWRTRAFDLRHENPQTQERRLRCRLRVRPRRLREDERRVIRANVRVNGQPVVGERVRLRGAGVAESAKTSRRGIARATVEPRRPGKLRARVRGVKNLRGCKAAARVRG